MGRHVIRDSAGTPMQVEIDGQYMGGDVSTASATSGAATLNAGVGSVTSESITTAAASTYTLTLKNSKITAKSVVLASAQLGSATTGVPLVETVTATAGQVVIVILNNSGSAAFNGTIEINFAVFN